MIDSEAAHPWSPKWTMKSLMRSANQSSDNSQSQNNIASKSLGVFDPRDFEVSGSKTCLGCDSRNSSKNIADIEENRFEAIDMNTPDWSFIVNSEKPWGTAPFARSNLLLNLNSRPLIVHPKAPRFAHFVGGQSFCLQDTGDEDEGTEPPEFPFPPEPVVPGTCTLNISGPFPANIPNAGIFLQNKTDYQARYDFDYCSPIYNSILQNVTTVTELYCGNNQGRKIPVGNPLMQARPGDPPIFGASPLLPGSALFRGIFKYWEYWTFPKIRRFFRGQTSDHHVYRAFATIQQLLANTGLRTQAVSGRCRSYIIKNSTYFYLTQGTVAANGVAAQGGVLKNGVRFGVLPNGFENRAAVVTDQGLQIVNQTAAQALRGRPEFDQNAIMAPGGPNAVSYLVSHIATHVFRGRFVISSSLIGLSNYI